MDMDAVIRMKSGQDENDKPAPITPILKVIIIDVTMFKLVGSFSDKFIYIS